MHRYRKRQVYKYYCDDPEFSKAKKKKLAKNRLLSVRESANHLKTKHSKTSKTIERKEEDQYGSRR